MASPQLENGYTKIANEILEALAKTQLSGYQSRVIFVIWRKLYGFHKKEDWIPISQIVEATNIHKAHISRTLKELIQRQIVTKIGNNKVTFQKDYEKWVKLPKMVTKEKLPKMVSGVTKNGIKKLPKMADSKDSKDIKSKDNGEKKKKKVNIYLPKGYFLEKKHIDYAISKGIKDKKRIEDMFEGFCIYHRKTGKKFIDWYAAWQTWVRNDVKWRSGKSMATHDEIVDDGLDNFKG